LRAGFQAAPSFTASHLNEALRTDPAAENRKTAKLREAGRREREFAPALSKIRSHEEGTEVPSSHLTKPLPPLSAADIQRFWSLVDKTQGQGPKGHCWTWRETARNGADYGNFYYAGKTHQATRVAYLIQHREDPYPDFVCHACDFPPCIRGEHLFKGDQLVNRQDASQKGRTASGDRNGSRTMPERLKRGADHPLRKNPELAARKLTAERVREIRKFDKDHPELSHREKGRQLGVNRGTYQQIVDRITWKHIED
jgi:hypothetical protein